MSNRKIATPKSASAGGKRTHAKKTEPKLPTPRKRFVISSKAAKAGDAAPKARKSVESTATVENVKSPGKAAAKAPANGHAPVAPVTTAASTVDLTETIKTLLHLAQEHGYITYDDINDVLPDNLSADDLDALLSKLRGLDVEIVMDQAEAERAERSKHPEAAPQANEEEEDSRLEILDDPVRMYMNQMGKVPLLTREQEVEICKRIEEAEVAMKAIVYGLGFTAKEPFVKLHQVGRENHLSQCRLEWGHVLAAKAGRFRCRIAA